MAYHQGSRIIILSLKRNLLERQAAKASEERDKVMPGRVPGRDLTGADLIGKVGIVVTPPDATYGHPVPFNPDPMVCVRVADEVLYLFVSEVAPVG